MTFTRSQAESILGFLRAPLIAATKTAAAFIVAEFLVWLAHFGVHIPDGTAGALIALIVACVATGWTFLSNLIAKRFPASAKVLGPAAVYHSNKRGEHR